MLKRLKISQKLVVCFLIVTLIASISGIFGMAMMLKTDRDYSSALVYNGFSQGKIGNFNTYLNKGGAVVRDIIVLSDPAEVKQAEDELNELQTKTNTAFEEMDEYCQSVDEQVYVKAISQKLPEYRALRDQVLDLGKQGKNSEALELFHSQARPVLNEIMVQAQGLADYNEKLGNTVSTTLTNQSRNTVILIIAVIVAAFAISMLFSIIVARSIARPIIKVKDVAARLAEGDLNIQITSDAVDEVGEMTRSFASAVDMLQRYIADISRGLGEIAQGNFNVRPSEDYKGNFKDIENAISVIIVSLSDTLSQINQAADQVSSGSDQVSSGAQALSQGATEQASSVEELAATINEISEQVRRNAESAKDASDKVNTVGDVAGVSNQRMKEMLSAMSEISESSSEIGKIIKAIEDIALQTNILALNAAVEAARAGAAGKGFAVVAEEVRNLASKSAEASKSTSVLIEKSLNAVENGTRIADDTAISLNGVVDGVKEITEVIDRISESSAEQAASIAQVTTGIDQISSVVQTNSATAEESAAASEELSGQAQMMKGLVDQFKLLSESPGGVARQAENWGSADTVNEHKSKPARMDYAKY